MQTLTIQQQEYAVVPMSDYQALLREHEQKQDFLDVLEYRDKLKNNSEEMLPENFAERLIFGENPFLVWREYRQLKLKELSEKSKIDSATLSRIENNKREPSIKQLQAIAKVLNVTINDLV